MVFVADFAHLNFLRLMGNDTTGIVWTEDFVYPLAFLLVFWVWQSQS